MATETINGLVFQAPRAFSGSLAGNYIYTAIYNMIIGQRVFGDNIKGLYNDLVDHFKTEGSMFGDRKLFYATNGIGSQPWTGDGEASNLLALSRNKQVSCQEVVINQYRQIRLTTDQYLSKKAWGDEGTFSKFNSILMQWIGDTKRIFESKLMNVHVGTVTGSATVNSVSVTFESGATAKADKEAQNRLNAQAIAVKIADLFDEMKDASTDYNDYGYLRSYNPEDLYIVYNAKYANEITKVDLPSLFHKDGLEPSYATKLPAKYFGRAVDETSDFGSGKVIKADGTVDYTKGDVRLKVEYTSGNPDTPASYVHLYPGDKLPATATIGCTGITSPTFSKDEVYVVDAAIICKIMHKESIPFMSAFETSTEFFNPRSLTQNHYLTWGYSELTYLKNYPMIKVVKA